MGVRAVGPAGRKVMTERTDFADIEGRKFRVKFNDDSGRVELIGEWGSVVAHMSADDIFDAHGNRFDFSTVAA
jgi:hypothetical protein